ncbi:hypothetical protein BWI15_30445 [Kribbella sp. ALI-6-A]|uniref:DUF6284 family protein n=1 Tax=Kribbella sp. ALI-6-A TaxID=1933817 RepID=UPI00097CA5ED|nr:DUF6284 family protein [Kribbella sp. ALI-6-A]ONI67448.1 hypothetical protein BWI15_30445 [Kribbella sp. ALI-6-A]
MDIIHLSVLRDDEPTAADLAAIELEWPLIAAEQDLLEAEIAFDNAGENVSDFDRRRIRRAERRVQDIARELAIPTAGAEVVA